MGKEDKRLVNAKTYSVNKERIAAFEVFVSFHKIQKKTVNRHLR